jgi:hypothetical protein
MNEPTTRRQGRFGNALLAAIAISFALITLFSLEPLPFLPESLRTAATDAGQMLVLLVGVVGALAVILGVLNLLGVHLRKLGSGGAQAAYSAITILALILVMVLHLLERAGILTVRGGPPDTPLVSLTLMDALQVTIESALAGILFFFLIFAAYRLLRRRVNAWGMLFVTTLVIVLVGYVQQSESLLYRFQDWLRNVPVSAGTRGLLIGIAIGTVVIGARVLIGQDRIFRE